MIVGVETLILHRSMTGVGNYLYNLLKALVESETNIEFRGLDYVTWRKLDRQFFAEIAQAQKKDMANATDEDELQLSERQLDLMLDAQGLIELLARLRDGKPMQTPHPS